MPNLTVWNNRWMALDETLQHVTSRISVTTLKSLAACLQAFGESQFDFFYQGFTNGQLLPSMHYPVEHVLGATLDQVSFDLLVIQRAADQRLDGSVKMKETLQKGDMLAQDALNRATQAGVLAKSAVVTYLHKSANTNVIPYAPVAMVGVPYASLTLRRDLLAIPHEIGHFVYHHADGLALALHQKFPFQPTWFSHWLEEVVADVYGCLVAGPICGLSFQDILLDSPLETIVTDDGEHPVEAIRPYVHIAVLHELGYTRAAAALAARWQGILAQRNQPTTFVTSHGDEEVMLADARVLLEETAVSVLSYLLTERQLNNPNRWSADLPAANSDVENLYTLFEDWVNGPLNLPVCELQQNGNRVGVTEGGGQLENVRQLGETATWRDWFKRQSLQHTNQKLPPMAWMPIYTTGFWPVKGPDGNSNTGMP